MRPGQLNPGDACNLMKVPGGDESLLVSAPLTQHLDCCPPFWRPFNSPPGITVLGLGCHSKLAIFMLLLERQSSCLHLDEEIRRREPPFTALALGPACQHSLAGSHGGIPSPPLSCELVRSTSFTRGTFCGQEAADDKTLPQKFRQPSLLFPEGSGAACVALSCCDRLSDSLTKWTFDD